MERPIIKALHDAVMARKGAVPELAAKLDRAPSTIYGALNPYVDPENPRRNVLGVEEAVVVMEVIGDHTALEIMAARLGFRLTPVESSPDGRDMTHECHQAVQAAAKCCDAADEGKVRLEDLAKLYRLAVKELDDVFMRYRAQCESKGVRVPRVRGIKAVERAAGVAS